MEGIKAFKDIAIAFFDAAAANPIMATAGGMLPFIVLSPFIPSALAGQLAVAAVAGLQNLPHVQFGWGIFSIAPPTATMPWPVNVTIVREGEAKRTDAKQVEEAKQLLKILGTTALKTMT